MEFLHFVTKLLIWILLLLRKRPCDNFPMWQLAPVSRLHHPRFSKAVRMNTVFNVSKWAVNKHLFPSSCLTACGMKHYCMSGPLSHNPIVFSQDQDISQWSCLNNLSNDSLRRLFRFISSGGKIPINSDLALTSHTTQNAPAPPRASVTLLFPQASTDSFSARSMHLTRIKNLEILEG